MLIDYITTHLPERFLTDLTISVLKKTGDRVSKINCKTGEVIYDTQTWDSIKSDSHNIAYRYYNGKLFIKGSPARVIGDGDAVFGNGASSKLDLYGCLQAMIRFTQKNLKVILPSPDAWNITRIDITDNWLLESEAQVYEILELLTHTKGGKYKFSSAYENSVYFNSQSKLKKSKVYAKGQDLNRTTKNKDYNGCEYSKEDIQKSRRLLRVELTLASEFLRKSIDHWTDLSAYDLYRLNEDYFSNIFGENTVKDEDELLKNLRAITTKRKAKNAYNFFLDIKSNGLETAMNNNSRKTSYEYKALLKKCGLGDIDFSNGEVVHIRKKIIEFSSINNWFDLRAA